MTNAATHSEISRDGRAQQPLTLVNVPDLSPADDDFTRLPLRQPVRWERLSGIPGNMLERRAPGLRLSRYRAAVQAALAAREGSAVISHLPLMSGATALAMRALGRSAPHLAFSFNFTVLPTGRALAYLRAVLPGVRQFAVYSRYEQTLYPELFGIDPARFSQVIWTQPPPPVDATVPLDTSTPYFCAIGGEGRDFDLLLAVAQRLPRSLRMVIVARPHSLAGRTLPDNVVPFVNIPAGQAWALANGSLGALIPLQRPDTCCGHITLVSAKLLGIPIATTRSFATEEYVEGRSAILQCEAGDVDGYARLLERLADEQAALRSEAQARRAAEVAAHDRSHWADYVSRFLESCRR